jgi:hypothetical protein
MASVSESSAFFHARLLAVGVDSAFLVSLEAVGINSLARLAYCTSVVPGSGDDKALVDFFKTVNNGVDLDEAHTMLISDLRNTVERSADTAPRVIPIVERASRLQAQRLRLIGMTLEAEFEPANSLVDLCNDMREQNALAYISPEVCVSRDSEILGVKKEKSLDLFKGDKGQIVMKETSETMAADVSTELRLKNAWTRRGLAMDQMNVFSFKLHSEWIDTMYARMLDVPPEGYVRVSVQQAMAADKALFVVMARMTRSGIVSTNVPGPVDVAYKNAVSDSRVQSLLMWLPSTSRQSTHTGPGNTAVKPVSKRQLKLQKKHAAIAARAAPIVIPTKTKQPKGKGKGKDKGSGAFSSMPAGLVGYNPKTSSGDPICFACNLDGCNGATWGGRCGRGVHECIKCHGAHGLKDCTS